jgi:simple sugar transport system permease protein
MQLTVQVPSALITAINGLVVMFVVASEVYVRRARRRAGREAAAASLKSDAAAPITQVSTS